MLGTTTGRKRSSARRRTLPAAVTTLTIGAELARCHTGLVIGAAIISVALALTADVVITAIHGSQVQSPRALYLFGMLLRRHESPDLGSSCIYLVLDPFGRADVTAPRTLLAATTTEGLMTLLAERAAADKATGQAQSTERGLITDGPSNRA